MTPRLCIMMQSFLRRKKRINKKRTPNFGWVFFYKTTGRIDACAPLF